LIFQTLRFHVTPKRTEVNSFRPNLGRAARFGLFCIRHFDRKITDGNHSFLKRSDALTALASALKFTAAAFAYMMLRISSWVYRLINDERNRNQQSKQQQPRKHFDQRIYKLKTSLREHLSEDLIK